MKQKIAVIVSHPIQYHSVIWRAFACQPEFDTIVCFLSDRGVKQYWDKEFGIHLRWNVDLLTGYRYRFFSDSESPRKGRFLGLRVGLLVEILTGGYDTVYFHGIQDPDAFATFLTSKLLGKTSVLRTISYNLNRSSGLRWIAKRLFYSVAVAMVDFLPYIGTHNRQFFRDFGASRRQLVHVPHLVDNQFFQKQADHLLGKVAILKEQFGLVESDKIILFVGKLFDKKQPLMLLNAFIQSGLPTNWKLLFVGDGDQKDELRKQAKTAEDRVRFAGFLNQDKISESYAIAEILVLPSQYGETWGLVVNEALNFGCCAIVSDQVGCGPDIVAGKTGLVFKYDNEEELKGALRSLVYDEKLRKQFQTNARPTVLRCNEGKFSERLFPMLIDPNHQLRV